MAGNFWKSLHSQQWILEKYDLLRERGEDLKILTEDEYQKVMIFFINLIHKLGESQEHRIKQQAIATACMYFKRFYARRSFRDIDPFCMVTTCLVLATKVDEFGMIGATKTVAILTSIISKIPGMPTPIPLAKQHVEEAEFALTEIMDCCLIVYNPYRPLTIFVQDMKSYHTKDGDKSYQIKDVDSLYMDGWRIVNDSLRTDAGLLFAPHTIALAAIMLAALFADRNNDLVPWLSDLNVDYEKVFDCQQTLISYYSLEYKENEVVEKLLKKLPKALSVYQKTENIKLEPKLERFA